MSRDRPSTSAVGRLARLGGLIGRVGASVAGSRLLELGRSGPGRELRRTENLVRNAARIVETLGQMKGAAMKVGQMLSLHEGLLPPEVAEVLRSLQKQAPKVPAEVMEYEVRGALPNFDALFESMEPEAFAAASIGQVHRARLRDGRAVAIKIQYPLIEEIIRADLKNLRVLLQSLFGLLTEVDFEPIWIELRDRLLEELDYTREAENARRLAELYADMPEIVIPRVVPEASTRRVLTMERLDGLSPAEACSERCEGELRSRWGVVLYEFVLRGLLRHRWLHADPNLANFAFLPDGRVIVYDFGCVKQVEPGLAAGYGRLMQAAVARDANVVPQILLDVGVSRADGSPLERDLLEPYVELFSEIVRESPPYRFGENGQMYDRIFELGLANWSTATDIRFPHDIVFIDRTLVGHFGNLTRLAAQGPWRELGLKYAGEAVRGAKGD